MNFFSDAISIQKIQLETWTCSSWGIFSKSELLYSQCGWLNLNKFSFSRTNQWCRVYTLCRNAAFMRTFSTRIHYLRSSNPKCTKTKLKLNKNKHLAESVSRWIIFNPHFLEKNVLFSLLRHCWFGPNVFHSLFHSQSGQTGRRTILGSKDGKKPNFIRKWI